MRAVVTFKSRRFDDSLEAFSGRAIERGEVFTSITQPEAQMRELLRATHDFFAAESVIHEKIKVSLMEWNDACKNLKFVNYFPDGDAPRAPEEAFKDTSTIAGKAYFSNKIAISEDLESDPGYQPLGDDEEGSLLSYPIYDDRCHRVVLVVNVHSSRVKRFRQKDSEALTLYMQAFGDRLLLEHRLVRLKRNA